jgi:exopolyphosphatase/guanosine-5'-triphosphate,3'-diphosphate pyrophosphatase
VEVTRLTFLSFQEFAKKNVAFLKRNLLIADVSGGATSLLHVDRGNIIDTQTLHFGTLRLYETLESANAESAKNIAVMVNSIERYFTRWKEQESLPNVTGLIALGSDMRFAASILSPGYDERGPHAFPVRKISALDDRLSREGTHSLMKKYQLSAADAQTVVVALKFYCVMARLCSLDEITIAPISMRNGALLALAGASVWTNELREQIFNSCMNLGRHYRMNMRHAEHVRRLSRTLFEALTPHHHLDDSELLLLECAAMLHDIGAFIAASSHHKHSMYIIRNSPIFGLSTRDRLLVSLIARYHRRAKPRTTHPEYALLDRYDRILVSKLAAILRVADALDRSDSQRIGNIECTVSEGSFTISVAGLSDISLERAALSVKADLFEDMFGLKVDIKILGKVTTL